MTNFQKRALDTFLDINKEIDDRNLEIREGHLVERCAIAMNRRQIIFLRSKRM